MDSIAKRFVTLLAIGAAALSAPACDGDDSLEGGGETLSRAQFIETYVQLRIAGLHIRGTELPLDRQKEVLDSLGVTEDQMLAFVEYWGSDGDVMEGIWQEVDSLIQQVRLSQGEELEADLEEAGPKGDEDGGDSRDPIGGEGGAGGDSDGEGVGNP
jgi:hypothetical protein